MSAHRLRLAALVLAAGIVIAVAAAALIVSGWIALQSARASHTDFYFVAPNFWTLVILFGVGAVSNIALRRQAANLGRPAGLISRVHLIVTGLLLIAALLGIGRILAVGHSQPTWPVVLVVIGAIPLMLLAHGTALAAGGFLALRTNRHG